MKREYYLTSLFFTIVAIFVYLFYLLIIPFFIPIAWAAVFVIIFYPVYEKLLLRMKVKGLTSLVVCFGIILLIIGPIAYLLATLVNEASNAVVRFNELQEQGKLADFSIWNLPFIEYLKNKLGNYYDFSQINTETIIKTYLDDFSQALIRQTKQLFANGAQSMFYFALMIFTMYYFFKDGAEIIHRLKRLMPLSSMQVDATFNKLKDVVEATMYGSLVVAILQGVLGGILFVAVGIPSAVFWGMVMAFLAIIPLVGASIVYLPAGVIMILGGDLFWGVFVIAFGGGVISQVDNFLRPKLISGKTSLHPLLLFFSILGGIYLFGLLGVIMGPIIAAIFLTLLHIFEFELHPNDIELKKNKTADQPPDQETATT